LDFKILGFRIKKRVVEQTEVFENHFQLFFPFITKKDLFEKEKTKRFFSQRFGC